MLYFGARNGNSYTVTAGTVEFLNAAPSPGDALDIRVTDADLNADAGVVETVDVEVENLDTGEIETVTLTETGVDTGIYEGALATADAIGPGTDEDGTLDVAGGDTVRVTYVDALPGANRTAEIEIAVPMAQLAWAGPHPGAMTLTVPAWAKTLFILAGAKDSQNDEFDTFTLDGVNVPRDIQQLETPYAAQIWSLRNPPTGADLDFVATWSGFGIGQFIMVFAAPVEYEPVGTPGAASDDTDDHASLEVAITTVNANALVMMTAKAQYGEDITASIPGLAVVNAAPIIVTGSSGSRHGGAYVLDAGAAGARTITWDFVEAVNGIGDRSTGVAQEYAPVTP